MAELGKRPFRRPPHFDSNAPISAVESARSVAEKLPFFGGPSAQTIEARSPYLVYLWANDWEQRAMRDGTGGQEAVPALCFDTRATDRMQAFSVYQEQIPFWEARRRESEDSRFEAAFQNPLFGGSMLYGGRVSSLRFSGSNNRVGRDNLTHFELHFILNGRYGGRNPRPKDLVRG